MSAPEERESDAVTASCDRGFFFCPTPQQQPHLLNLDGPPYGHIALAAAQHHSPPGRLERARRPKIY